MVSVRSRGRASVTWRAAVMSLGPGGTLTFRWAFPMVSVRARGRASETWRAAVMASRHTLFMNTNSNFPAVRSTRTACLAHRLVSGVTLKEAVAVKGVGPEMTRLARRKVVRRRRSRSSSGDKRREQDGKSLEMHVDLLMVSHSRR